MKVKALILFLVLACGSVFAQVQVFNVIAPLNGTITPSGTVSVPAGSNARFFLIANSGYEPYAFLINGQLNEGSCYEYLVESVQGTITVEAQFASVHDAAGPYVKITSPASASVTQIGSPNTIGLVFSIVNETSPQVSVYKNDALLSATPVKRADGNWECTNLPLTEGDNVFMVMASDASGNYSTDFELVHYSVTAKDNVRALVLIDQRLNDQPNVSAKLSTYISKAMEYCGPSFDISIQVVNGIDDWTTDQVRSNIASFKTQHPFLEGVLLVGNIKLPSFYAPRPDILEADLITHKYEDLDIILQKQSSSTLADYDYMAKGSSPLPDLWCAILPVGYEGGSATNGYANFAAQLIPFFDKVTRIYNTTQTYSKLYLLSNQIWDLGPMVAEFGSSGIDYYAVNDTGKCEFDWTDGTVPTSDYYKRAPINNYSTYADFAAYYRRWPWIGENWQDPAIYLNHMTSNNYKIVWTNVHSLSDLSVIPASAAKTMTKGGLVQFATGCLVASIKQPNGSYTDNNGYAVCFPADNILCSYVYGSSDFVVGAGCPFPRAFESEFNRMSPFMAQGDYIGLAHFFRKCIQYHNSGDPDNFKFNTQELFIGDPFIKIQSIGNPAPTVAPTVAPTQAPTIAPTTAPTLVPTATPTTAPTSVPTVVPTQGPTAVPTATPTIAPTSAPTVVPTIAPTAAPTAVPTPAPTTVPGSCTCTAGCSATIVITVPFIKDGSGEFCYEAISLGSNVNSWNTDVVNINGTNFTNTYVPSSAYPLPINGKYYVYYKSSGIYGHMEIK